MALPGVYKINVQTRVDDRVCSFGQYWRVTSGGDPLSDALNLCSAWRTANLTKMLACLAEDVSFEGVYAHAFDKGTAMPARSPGDGEPGTVSGTSCPANQCAVVTLQVNEPEAKRHGRIYLSGLAKESLTSGLWDATFTSGALTTFADQVWQSLSAGGTTFENVVIQRVLEQIEIEPVAMVVRSTRVTRIPYSQRRRTSKQYGYLLA